MGQPCSWTWVWHALVLSVHSILFVDVFETADLLIQIQMCNDRDTLYTYHSERDGFVYSVLAGCILASDDPLLCMLTHGSIDRVSDNGEYHADRLASN